MQATRNLLAPLMGPVTSLLIAAAPSGAQAVVNVSHLVNGGAKESLPMVLVTVPVDCSSSVCSWQTVARAGMTDSYDATPGPYAVGSWPPVWSTALPAPADVPDSLPIPAPSSGSYEQPSNGVWQRARVAFTGVATFPAERLSQVQTFRTGSGMSTVNYTVRISAGATSQRYFLDLGIPQRVGGGSSPYYTINNQYFYDTVDRLQSRAVVDVYVDGLPVWSTSTHTLKPKNWSHLTFGRITLNWGEDPATDRVVLFLGSLAKTTRTVSVVIRSDLRVWDDECRSDSVYGNTVVRCHANFEGYGLPAKAVSNGYFNLMRPDVRVYTR